MMKPERESSYAIYKKIKNHLQAATQRKQLIYKPSAAIIANIVYDKRSTQKRLRKALKLLWITPNYSELSQARGNILTWNVKREDHKRSAEDMCTSLQEGKFKLTYIADIEKDCSRKLDVFAILKAVKIAIKCKQNIINTIYITCALTYSIKSIQKIKKEKITEKIKTLVCYNSSNIPECFIAATCREEGIKTFSLQHGLYYEFKSPPPLAVINYENVVADELLVWSEFCKKQIEKFYESENKACDFSMPIAGYFKTGLARPSAAQEATSQTSKHLLCLLPGPDDLAASIALLNLLKKLSKDYRITVRLHPLTALETVTKALPERAELDANRLLADTLSRNHFSIAVGFNSTSLFEALLADIYCATFTSTTNNFPDMPIDEFSCIDELENLIRINSKNTASEDKNYLLGSNIFKYESLIIPTAR